MIPQPVRELLDHYARTHAAGVRLWARAGAGWTALYPADAGADAPGPAAVEVGTDGAYRLEVVGACGGRAHDATSFLAAALEQLLRTDERAHRLAREVVQVSAELAERYEEITLLYSINEILGSVISVEDAAQTILSEVSATLGARRAALWVHDPARQELYLAASVGMNGQEGPISLDDPGSVTADVFRRGEPLILDPHDVFPRGEHDTGATRRGYFLSVPVSYTPPQGETRTVGVVNLVGRTSDEPFSAGDVKLVSAIATQIGAAVENGRLVSESLRQERVLRELELAHDLQLKLLPSAEQFADYARVAARCVPAESVGGDFYHLFRLSGGRIGVMIGDVSTHGFSAALIMALTMSAVAIHASEGDPPAEVLRRVHRALIDELETTEMFLTLFYGVIDPAAGRLTYANAGHHHAFRIDAAGAVQRLGVTNPPLGMADLDAYTQAELPWAVDDLLFLFTDGLSDALPGGEPALLARVVSGRDTPPEGLLDEIFAATEADSGVPRDDRTAVLLRL